MIEIADIKAIATPEEVARRFLGSPGFERYGKMWYCSPFRNEQHPSFKVDSVGMYDFGTNEAYDVISFVQRFKNCSFRESVDILAREFGISDREYTDRKTIEWYKRQREEQRRYQEFLDKFYLFVWDKVDEEYHENKECLKCLRPRSRSLCNMPSQET